MDVLLAIAAIGLIVVWLARRGAAQTGPRSRLAGSTDIVDRDAARVAADLRARQQDRGNARSSAGPPL
ncbi:hypothetical protein [Actinopolymorpha sp. B9G3]|uniref:hypothetical protein n=1 Tax=Actinopolymorpha sp. B9G3 TaxID=3158970 RepID=UPI0032D99B92